VRLKSTSNETAPRNAPVAVKAAVSSLGNAGAEKADKINKAMMAYLERAEAHSMLFDI